MNTYPATTSSSVSFVSDGYVNQALYFRSNLNESLSAPYIPLGNISFTIEAWIKPTLFGNVQDHSLLGICPSAINNECLHVVLRRSSSNVFLYFGFYFNDCRGNTPLSLNQWMHVAFVFNITTLSQSVYLNGQLDGNCTTTAPLMVTNGIVTIGVVPGNIPVTNLNFYHVSYLDYGASLMECSLFRDIWIIYRSLGERSQRAKYWKTPLWPVASCLTVSIHMPIQDRMVC